jgi:hypothetical protein
MSAGRALIPFEYAVLRVVPRVERGEAINAGVLVYSQAASFLGARVHLDAGRVRALDPSADLASIEAALQAAARTCDGAGAGPAAAEEIGRRFRAPQHRRPTRPRPHRTVDRPGRRTGSLARAARAAALSVAAAASGRRRQPDAKQRQLLVGDRCVQSETPVPP